MTLIHKKEDSVLKKKDNENDIMSNEWSTNASASDEESFEIEMTQDEAGKKSMINKKLIEGNK